MLGKFLVLTLFEIEMRRSCTCHKKCMWKKSSRVLVLCPSTNEEKFSMKNISYSSAVGSLMYVMVCTRSDIAHVVGMVSRYLSNPRKDHWEAVKWVMLYLRGSSNLKLTLGCKKPMLVGYTETNSQKLR